MVWVQCGHEVRFEARRQLTQLLSFVLNPNLAMMESGLYPPRARAAVGAPAAGGAVTSPVASAADVTKKAVARKGSKLLTSPSVTKTVPPSLPPSIRGTQSRSPPLSPMGAAVTSGSSSRASPQLVPPPPAEPPGKMDVMLAKQASAEAAFQQSVEESKRRQADAERVLAEKVAREQEERRAAWEREDRARLEALQRSMSQRQEERSKQVRTEPLLPSLPPPLAQCAPSPSRRRLCCPSFNGTSARHRRALL